VGVTPYSLVGVELGAFRKAWPVLTSCTTLRSIKWKSFSDAFEAVLKSLGSLFTSALIVRVEMASYSVDVINSRILININRW
jgi:hypothetical protein